jgi:histone acetyltransferase (RNA polymerase elongator complex component)
MAKKSAVERNDKRKRMAKKFAAKRAALMAIAKDQSLSNEERFKARLQLAKLPRNSAPTRVRNRCGVRVAITVNSTCPASRCVNCPPKGWFRAWSSLAGKGGQDYERSSW